MSTIQVVSIGGKLIDKASWPVPNLYGLAIGQTIQVNVPIKDKALVKALSKLKATVLETEENGHSVTLTYVVEKFTHMLELDADLTAQKMDGMAWIKPVDRLAESITLYLLDRDACDPKFLTLVKSGPTQT